MVDGNFDLDTLRAQGVNFELKGPGHQLQEDTTHGTAVALLIAAIAPGAQLLLYPVLRDAKVKTSAIYDAIDDAVQSSVDVLNLSLGRPANKKPLLERFKHLGSSAHCDLCAATGRAIDAGIVVAAAAGNALGEAFCPARRPAIASIGFITEVRVRQPNAASESVFGQEPSYDQSFEVDWAPLQPPNALGSSFATPLYSGLAALVEDRSWLPAYLRSHKSTGVAEYLHASLRQSGDSSLKDAVTQLYQQALHDAPHVHNGNDEGPSCVACSLCMSGLYINAGLHFLEGRHFESASILLKAAFWLAPWSPHAAANLATLHREHAIHSLRRSVDEWPAHRWQLQQSRKLYQHALTIRPEFEPYAVGLAQTEDALQQLKAWSKRYFADDLGDF